MDIPPRFIIHETPHWILNHHMSSKLPGYLVLGTKHPVRALFDLPASALAELGVILASVQKKLQTELDPKWLYISRFGHDPRFPVHFHFIPVYHWVEELFWQNDRYRLLRDLGAVDAQSACDGAELTLFVWREFGEKPEAPNVQGPSIEQIIDHLRLLFKQEY